MEDPLAESIRVEDKAGRLVALQALATFRAVRPTVKTRLLIDPFVSGEFVASLHARVVEYGSSVPTWLAARPIDAGSVTSRMK